MSVASELRANSASHLPAVHVTDVPTAVQLMQCAPQPGAVVITRTVLKLSTPDQPALYSLSAAQWPATIENSPLTYLLVDLDLGRNSTANNMTEKQVFIVYRLSNLLETTSI